MNLSIAGLAGLIILSFSPLAAQQGAVLKPGPKDPGGRLGGTATQQPIPYQLGGRGSGGILPQNVGGTVLPRAYATKMGQSANTFPHAQSNMRYQQVFLGSEIGGIRVWDQLCLRFDERSGGPAQTQRITLKLGDTTRTPANLTTNFANNYRTGPFTVFSGNLNLPRRNGGGTVTSWGPCIKFTRPIRWGGSRTLNLLVEFVNTSRTSRSHFEDKCQGSRDCTTTRIWANSATARVATNVQRNAGLVMCLRRVPDLVISAVSVSSATTLVAGGLYSITSTTRNIGGSTAGRSTTVHMISTNTTITTADTLVGIVSVPALAPGRTFTTRRSFNLPFCTRSSTCFAGAIADVARSVAEENEGNNTRATTARRCVALTNTRIRMIEHVARYPNVFAFGMTLKSTQRRRAGMCVKAPGLPGGLYVLTWSQTRSPFVFDSSTFLASSLVNSVIMPFWFSGMDSTGQSTVQLALNWPGVPSFANTFYVHGWFFDNRLRFRGTATANGTALWSLRQSFTR